MKKKTAIECFQRSLQCKTSKAAELWYLRGLEKLSCAKAHQVSIQAASHLYQLTFKETEHACDK